MISLSVEAYVDWNVFFKNQSVYAYRCIRPHYRIRIIRLKNRYHVREIAMLKRIFRFKFTCQVTFELELEWSLVRPTNARIPV
jgi:hypothetical protein